MTIGVHVSANLPEFKGWIRLAATKQIPFALARALTAVARVAREDVVQGLPLRFVVRGGRLAQSIRYKPADKRQWPTPRSVVYTLAEALELQELGGTKRPRRKDLAIPGAGTRPTPSTRITPSKRPASVLRKKGYFVGKISSGANAGSEAIFRRTSKARYPLQVSYLLRPSAHVTAVLGFQETVQTRVRTTLDREYLRSMRLAFGP